MPAQQPLQYREIEDQYNKARSSGLFSEGSLQDFAQIGDYYQPGRYSPVADASWIGLKQKQLSAGIDKAFEWTGLPQVAGELGAYAFPKLGGTAEAGEQAMESLPRAFATMAIPMATSAIGRVVGGVGGAAAGSPSGPGAIGTAVAGQAAGAATGAAVGNALVAYLFGVDAYEKSDSVKRALFAAAVPKIAGAFGNIGSKAAMSILPKIPGASKIGLTGYGTSAERVLEHGLSAESPGFITTTTDKFLKGAMNKAAYVGGEQLAQVGGFAGLDLFDPDVTFNRDYWLSQAATMGPFSLPSMKRFFRPGEIKVGETSNTVDAIRPLFDAPKTRMEVLKDQFKAINPEDPQAVNKFREVMGFDYYYEDLRNTAEKDVAELSRGEKQKANFELHQAFDGMPEYQANALDGFNVWKKLKNDTTAEGQEKLKIFQAQNPGIKHFEAHDKKLKGIESKAKRAVMQIETKFPSIDRVDKFLGTVVNDLQLFGANEVELMAKSKGERSRKEYFKALLPRGWSAERIKKLHEQHVMEAKFSQGIDFLSDDNKKLYEKKDWFNNKIFEEPVVAPKAKATKPANGLVPPVAATPPVNKAGPILDVLGKTNVLSAEQQRKAFYDTAIKNGLTPEAADKYVNDVMGQRPEDNILADVEAIPAAERAPGVEIVEGITSEGVGPEEIIGSHNETASKLFQSLDEAVAMPKAEVPAVELSFAEKNAAIDAEISAAIRELNQQAPMGLDPKWVTKIAPLYVKKLVLNAKELGRITLETIKKFFGAQLNEEQQKAVFDAYYEQTRNGIADPEIRLRLENGLKHVNKWIEEGNFSETGELIRTALDKATALEQVHSTRDPEEYLSYTLKKVYESYRAKLEGKEWAMEKVLNPSDIQKVQALIDRKSFGDAAKDMFFRLQRLSKTFNPGGRPENQMDDFVLDQTLKLQDEALSDPDSASRAAKTHILDFVDKTLKRSGAGREVINKEDNYKTLETFGNRSDTVTGGKGGEIAEEKTNIPLAVAYFEEVLKYIRGGQDSFIRNTGDGQDTATATPFLNETRKKLIGSIKPDGTPATEADILDFRKFQKGGKLMNLETALAETKGDPKALKERIERDLNPILKQAYNKWHTQDQAITTVGLDQILDGTFRKQLKLYNDYKPEGEKTSTPVQRLSYERNPDKIFRQVAVREMLKEQDISQGVVKSMKSWMKGILFDEKGRPKPKLDTFFHQFLNKTGKMENGKPVYRLNERKINQIFGDITDEQIRGLRKGYLDLFVQQNKSDYLFSRNHLVGLNHQGVEAFTPTAMHLFARISRHPAFAPLIPDWKARVLDGRMSPQDFINAANFAESEPPPHPLNEKGEKIFATTDPYVYGNTNKASAKGYTIPELLPQLFAKTRTLESISATDFLNDYVFPKFAEQNLTQYQKDNIRIEVLRHLWENPFLKGPVIRPSHGTTKRQALRGSERVEFSPDKQAQDQTVESLAPEYRENPYSRIRSWAQLIGKEAVQAQLARDQELQALRDQRSAYSQSVKTQPLDLTETLKAAQTAKGEAERLRAQIQELSSVKAYADPKAYEKLKADIAIFHGGIETLEKLIENSPIRRGDTSLTKKQKTDYINHVKQLAEAQDKLQKLVRQRDLADIANPDKATRLQELEQLAQIQEQLANEHSAQAEQLRSQTPIAPKPKSFEEPLTQTAGKEPPAKKHTTTQGEMILPGREYDKGRKGPMIVGGKVIPGEVLAGAGIPHEWRFSSGTDTDFLTFRERLQEDPSSTLPHQAAPETLNFLQRFGLTAQAAHGTTPELKSLLRQMQDSGSEFIISPDHQMDDFYLGKNNLQDALDASALGRRVAYFAEPHEIPALQEAGLVRLENSSDLLFHTPELSVAKSLVKSSDLFRKAIESIGGDENIEALMKAHEAVAGFYGNSRRIDFREMTKGNETLAGATNVRGKVQMLFQHLPDSWHKFGKKDQVTGYWFTLAHELGHGVEFLRNQGRLGEEGTKIYSELEKHLEGKDPRYIANVVDIMAQTLPKDLRHNPAIKEILSTTDLKGNPKAAHEFIANMMAIEQMGFLEHNVGVFKDAMKMLPTPVRNHWQWFMRMMSDFVSAGRALFNGKAREDSKWISEKLTQLRNEANKAEKEIEDLQFFADLDMSKVGELQNDWVEDMTSRGVDSKLNEVFRNAEVKPGPSESGTIGMWGKVIDQFNRWVPRLETESLYSEPQARIMNAMRGPNQKAKQMTIETLSELFTETGKIGIFGKPKIDKRFKEYTNNERLTGLGQKVFEWTQVPGNDGKAKFVDGKFQFDTILPKGSKGREMYDRLSDREKELFVLHEKGIFNAYKMQAMNNVNSIDDHNKALMAQSYGASNSDRHRQASEHTSALYDVMLDIQTNPDRNAVFQAYAKFEGIKREFDNEVNFNSSMAQAQKMIEMREAVRKFYEEHPSYENTQRHAKWLTRIQKPGEKEYETIHAGTAEAMELKKQEARENGYKIIGVEVPGDKTKESHIDTKLFDMLGDHQRKLIAMVGDGTFGVLDADTTALMLDAIGEADVRKVMADYQGQKNFHLPGSGKKFIKGFETLDRTAQLFKYTSGINKMLAARVTKARAGHELNSPLLKNNAALKQRLRQQVDQFLTPDTQLGSAITKVNAVMHLGLNFPSHVIETFQPVTQGLHNLVGLGHGIVDSMGFMKTGEMAALKEYKHRLKSKLKGDKKIGFNTGNKDHDDLLNQMAAREELDASSMQEVKENLDELALHSQLANGEAVPGKVLDALNNYARFVMHIYNAFPTHNNIVGHVMGYEAARKRINPATVTENSPGRLFNHQEAIEEANRFNRAAMLSGGRAGRQAGPYEYKTAGQAFMSLQSYSTGTIGAFVGHLDRAFSKARYPELSDKERVNAKKAATTMLATQLFFGGLMGIPFAGAGLKLLSELTEEDQEANIREMFMDFTENPAIVEMLMEGGANAALAGGNIPIDVSSKMGMAGGFGFNPITGFDAKSLLGPTGSLIGNAFKMAKPLLKGNFAEAMSIGGPTGFKRLAEIVADDNEFRAYDGSPLLNENMEQTAMSKAMYSLGFGNQDVKRAKKIDLLNSSIKEYASKRTAQEVTELAGLVKDKSWVAQQKLIDLVTKKVHALPEWENMNEVQQAINYRKEYMETVEQIANRYVDLELPVDPRREMNKRSAKTMTKLISGMETELPDSTQMLRMTMRDAVYQKMGLAPVKHTRKTIQENMQIDQIQNANPGYSLPQVRALAGS